MDGMPIKSDLCVLLVFSPHSHTLSILFVHTLFYSDNTMPPKAWPVTRAKRPAPKNPVVEEGMVSVMLLNCLTVSELVLAMINILILLCPSAYPWCMCYLLVLFCQFYDCLPLMCITGPSIRATRLILDLAVILILSSYSPHASYLPYLPL